MTLLGPKVSSSTGAAAGRAGGRWGVLLNFAVFKAGWLICVAGAARGATLPAVAWALLAAGLAVALSPRPSRLALMLPACMLLGLAADGLLVARGSITFPLDPPAVLGMPVWIAAIWLLFATTFDGCMAWMASRPVLAFVGGAVGSPLSYRGAAALGALEVTPGWPDLLAVSLVWGLLLPLQFVLVKRILGAPAVRGEAAEPTLAD